MLLAVSVSVAACSEESGGERGGSGGGTEAGPVPEDELVEALAEATCRGMSTCCEARSLGFDEAACRQNVRDFWYHFLPRPSTLIQYDADAAGRCVRASHDRAAACEYPDTETEPCNRMHVGTLPPGAACEQWDECAPVEGGEPECDFSGGGVCVNTVRGEVGDPCYETYTQDGFTYIYSGPGGSGVGVQEENTQIRCWTNDGVYCASGNDPVCQALVEVGGECESSSTDGMATCVDEAVCDSTERICVARTSVGGECSPGFGVFTRCAQGSYCTEAGICEPRQPDGAPCDILSGTDCMGLCRASTDTCTGAFAAGYVSAETCAGSVMPEYWF